MISVTKSGFGHWSDINYWNVISAFDKVILGSEKVILAGEKVIYGIEKHILAANKWYATQKLYWLPKKVILIYSCSI